MNDLPDDEVRSAWSAHSDRDDRIDIAAVRTSSDRHAAKIRRRDRKVYASAAIIIPSWAAAIWLMPDLRLVATSGLLLGVWLVWQLYRRSAARLGQHPLDLTCVAFQRELLRRERDLSRSMPKWYLAPVVAGQFVIIITLLTNPRFEKNGRFVAGLAMFVGTTVTVLAIAYRRWQREAQELERELATLEGGSALKKVE